MPIEQNPESVPPPRIPMGPPEWSISGAKAIFWNEREFRAVWRLLIYLLFFTLFILAGNYLTMALHLPQINRTGLAAASMLVQECVGLIAMFAAAAIMGLLEARPLGGYGLPRASAFGARFWQGAAWGITMITGIIFLIRAFHGFSFGEVALRGSALWGYAVLWGAGFICVGLSEEFLFR